MKKARKNIWKRVLLVCSIVVIIMGIMIFFQLPKALQANDSSYDLSKIDDGIYKGDCDNGLVKVKVEVHVNNHAIHSIALIEHQNGKGKKAEKIINTIVHQQRLEVDAISGATFSSQTILKAVETALAHATMR